MPDGPCNGSGEEVSNPVKEKEEGGHSIRALPPRLTRVLVLSHQALSLRGVEAWSSPAHRAILGSTGSGSVGARFSTPLK